MNKDYKSIEDMLIHGLIENNRHLQINSFRISSLFTDLEDVNEKLEFISNQLKQINKKLGDQNE